MQITLLSHHTDVVASLIETMLERRLKFLSEDKSKEAQCLVEGVESMCNLLRIDLSWLDEHHALFTANGFPCANFRDAVSIRHGYVNYNALLEYDKARKTALEVDKHAAVWLKTDGTWETVIPVNGKNFQLEELYKFISTNGNEDNCIEVIQISNKGKVFCGEDNGIALGYPTNLAATVYCAGSILMEGCGIVGNCLICNDGMIE